MTNKEIANTFKLLADLMELHGENSIKAKTYMNTYLSLKKYERDLNLAFYDEIINIPGIGASVADKVMELLNTDRIAQLDNLIAKTPQGVVQMLSVRGLGPKKVKAIWDTLKIEDLSELLLACNENRLVEVKGFGLKTQEDIKHKIEFYLSNSGKYHYAIVEPIALELLSLLCIQFPDDQFDLTGTIKRKCPIIEQIDLVSTNQRVSEYVKSLIAEEDADQSETYKGIKIVYHFADRHRYGNVLFETSSQESFMSNSGYQHNSDFNTEHEIFVHLNIPYIDAACREWDVTIDRFKQPDFELIQAANIKGVVHSHCTYSDGLHSLKDMADACQKKGYEYLVISDHSVSAFYANGLSIERVQQQWREIDQLNNNSATFKIFKGIESDILSDGSLDYPEDILSGFDVIIASIHSNLKMDEEKANARLIKAIEHPRTRILGHLTGRLLLGRHGYDIDHRKVIDACAANNVVIELNANPQRLDIDWTWLPYALEKHVLISINPDAHSIAQIDYIKYGVFAAMKGLLSKSECLNTKDLKDFTSWINSKK